VGRAKSGPEVERKDSQTRYRISISAPAGLSSASRRSSAIEFLARRLTDSLFTLASSFKEHCLPTDVRSAIKMKNLAPWKAFHNVYYEVRCVNILI
jgi:hypothetical protein